MTLGLIWILACGEKEISDTAIEPEDTSTDPQNDSGVDTEPTRSLIGLCPMAAAYLSRLLPSNAVSIVRRDRVLFGCSHYYDPACPVD